MFKYRCIQTFQAEGAGELSINADDLVISPTNQPNEGWLSVKALRGGQEGYVPFAYLEFVALQNNVTPKAEPNFIKPDINTVPTMPENTTLNAPIVNQNVYMGAGSTVPAGLNQPSLEGLTPASPHTANSNPFDTFGTDMQAGLPQAGSAFQTQAPLDPSVNSTNKRHSYANSSSLSGNSSTKDQYNAINPDKFHETLELWRERERRFMKGEAERLPEVKKREYFYWDQFGNRLGPFTEDEMRSKFETGQISGETQISINIDGRPQKATTLAKAFPDVQCAFKTAPKVEKDSSESMWVYKDDMGNAQGPFSSTQMRDWFQDGYFNAETKVKLAHLGDDAFVELGLLFPEGEGAFLSDGDQIGARAKQAEINQGVIAGTGIDAGFGAGYDPNQFLDAPPAAAPYDYGSNPFGGFDAPLDPAPPATWGGDADYFNTTAANQFGTMPPPALGATDGGLGMPPPAIGGLSGAPPPALQAKQSDDWGITWDDEDDVTGDVPNSEELPRMVGDNEIEDEEEPAQKILSFSELEKRYLRAVDNLYVFLTRSLPKELGVVQCKIKRSCVGLHVNYNLYELYLEKDGHLGPQILIAQKHRKFGVDSYYNIAIGSVNKNETGKVISSLVFNGSGTNFVCHNNVAAHKGEPRDLAVIHYQKGGHQKTPRKFSVAIPAILEGSETEQVKWAHKGSVKKSVMLQNLNNLEFKGLQALVNKKPTWSKKHQSWVLNFHGRVTRSSVKNFQLVRPDEQKTVVLQFGRIGSDSFTCDMQWPISPVAAFAMCVSSLHSSFVDKIS